MGPATRIVVLALATLTIVVGATTAPAAIAGTDEPGVDAPTELQDEFPLGEPRMASAKGSPGDSAEPIWVDDGSGRSLGRWLAIALALGAAALAAATLPSAVRRFDRRAIAGDEAPEGEGTRQPRPRHVVSPQTIRLVRPLFRYCHLRQAFVLRLIGERFGPVLQQRTGLSRK